MISKRILLTVIGLVVTIGSILLFVSLNKKAYTSSDLDLILQTGTTVVEMYRDEYTPSVIKIQRGTAVTFVNKSEVARWPASDLHPSHGIYPEFDPRRPIASGEEWSYIFDKMGEWTMHDHLAPYITGKILVVE